MPIPTRKDTKSAILDAAELLMAEHGINGVSLRAILAEAVANSASLHYHFGSREAVVEAILARSGRAITLRRREMLDELDASGQAPNVYDLVNAVVDPMIEFLQAEGESGRRFLRFIARLQSDRSGIHRALEEHYFPDVLERVARMLSEACPHLEGPERKRRATMMIDTMLQSLANADVLNEEWRGKDHEDALMEHAESLKSFLAGGLSAPAQRAPTRSRHALEAERDAIGVRDDHAY